MAAALQQRSAFFAGARATTRKAPRLTAVSNGTKITMSRDLWLPGSKAPAHLDGTLPADYGFDPLGLGQNKELLRWYVESELVHCRWAMLAVAGILGQELYRPDVFWYEAALKTESPFSPMGLLAFEFFAMHFVEVKRWLDWRNPGSQDVDPLFPQNKLKPHAVGYPGFTFFIPGDLEKLKVNEIRNGRLAMLAFIGFTMAAQVTGLNPLAALSEHLADPFGTTIFSKAAIVPGSAVAPPCAIAPTQEYYGITLPTPCFLQGLWP